MPPANAEAAPPAPPTHARYWVVVFAVSLAIIQYIDRVCISQAAPFISKDLHLTDAQMGWVLRPFIGDPNHHFSLFRLRESNFFEAVFHAISHLS